MFCFVLFVFWAETPIFIVFSAKYAKLKETHKTKNTLFVNTLVLIALVKMSVFFLHFDFCCFWNFHVFQRFLIAFQNSKNNKYESNKNKKQQQENKMQSKNKSKIMIQKPDNKQRKTKKKNRRAT